MKKPPFTLALVTGASSGIGEALCRLLASRNIALMITGRNLEKLHELASELSSHIDVTIFAADLADPTDRKEVIQKCYEYVPDLVINNAGFGLYGEALTYETQEQMEILEVNGNAVLELTLEAARAMLSANKQGVILNVSSTAAMQVFPCFAVYAAAKAFVSQLSESLDNEMRYYGIRVLTSCPGMVETQFRTRASGGVPVTEKSSFRGMSAAFAAEQIWYQIEKKKPLHVFDWKYRIGTFFTKYLLPKAWVAKILRAIIESRFVPRDKRREEKKY
jgi:uncharacterized protein